MVTLKSPLPSSTALLPLDERTKPGQWCIALVAEDGGGAYLYTGWENWVDL